MRKLSREIICERLIDANVRHPEVFKGLSDQTQEHGWHFIEFRSNVHIFIGRNLVEALGFISKTFYTSDMD